MWSWLAEDFVLGVDEAGGVCLGFEVAEFYVAVECAEEGDAGAEEDGDVGDLDFVDESGAEEGLDELAAVDVGVAPPL